MARGCRAGRVEHFRSPLTSGVDLFRYCEGIVNFNAEGSDGVSRDPIFIRPPVVSQIDLSLAGSVMQRDKAGPRVSHNIPSR
jgi:hypothetical protein